jgi:hypothetical protein
MEILLKSVLLFLLLISNNSIKASTLFAKADTIFVKANGDEDTQNIQNAINQAKKLKGKPVVIKLDQTNYSLTRENSSKTVYHVSNTTTVKTNPNPLKHIGLWLKGMKNVTIDGGGALLVTYGKMTTFVIDGCENITLQNFSVTADDPTVVEMKVVEVGNDYLVTKTHTSARYEINDGKLCWLGHDWKLEGGIAQIYDPETNYSTRCTSPMSNIKNVEQLKNGLLRFNYKKAPNTKPGLIYQMRDGLRDEVAGFIVKSKNVILQNIKMHFLGNFGIVGQYSENITYNQLICEPELGSGRSCAGFADFVQMSGCKGKIKIINSRFEGAQDDPINIHGTHLAVQEYIGEKQIKVKFMHPESYGFEAFFRGDAIELVNANTLLSVQKAKIASVNRIDDNEIILTLNEKVNPLVKKIAKVVIENVSWTPEVEISNCYFSRIPTRGILISTRRKVLIDNNVFFHTPMSGILIADDARSWYESGPVYDVTIKNNNFIECGSPVINIRPENNQKEGYVHKNIRIEGNRFTLKNNKAIYAKSTSGIVVKNNVFLSREMSDPTQYMELENCEKAIINGNKVIKTKSE